MQRAIDEVTRRRKIQLEYNKKHNITPQTIVKPIRDKIIDRTVDTDKPKNYERIKLDIAKLEKKLSGSELLVTGSSPDSDEYIYTNNQSTNTLITQLTKQMKSAAKDLDFERAAVIRDRINELQDLPQ